jgi:environmental stress-induced protein Ves
MKYLHWTVQDYQIMPWKNGLGSTTQILISPENTSVQENNFDWRISSAQLSLYGSFSLFPGYDRFLLLVQGNEMMLNTNGFETSVKSGQVFRFTGEDTISYKTSDENTKDLNLFIDRAKVCADLCFFEGQNQHQISGKKKYFIISLNGISKIDFENKEILELNHLECCQFIGEFDFETISVSTHSAYVLIWIDNKH